MTVLYNATVEAIFTNGEERYIAILGEAHSGGRNRVLWTSEPITYATYDEAADVACHARDIAKQPAPPKGRMS